MAIIRRTSTIRASTVSGANANRRMAIIRRTSTIRASTITGTCASYRRMAIIRRTITINTITVSGAVTLLRGWGWRRRRRHATTVPSAAFPCRGAMRGGTVA